jgi:hypothetical protein
MLSWLSPGDVAVGLRLLRGLRPYLRQPITPDEARRTLAARLAGRGAAFLALARRIYRRPESVYRRLLVHAGCEYGDLERMVQADGVEGALTSLYRAGVYATTDEIKGRRPVRRGSLVLETTPASFLNPDVGGHFWVGTGGSSGATIVVPIDVAFTRDCAVDTCLVMEARGGSRWIKANWGVPGGGSLAKVLEFSGFGAPPVRWFSQLDPRSRDLHPRYRWSVRLIRTASWMAGKPLPPPQHVPVDDPLPIVVWLHEVIAGGDTPHLFTFASSAVRVCQTALAHGIDIAGARFMLVGEPTTDARLASILRVGAQGLPRYATTESGAIAYGCLTAADADDQHVVEDCHAIIQPGAPHAVERVPADGVLLTTLTPTVPLVLFNASMGDRAQVTEARCGCPLESLGWRRHLRHVRSFEKLTGSGMAISDVDAICVLEETLPARFGGTPTHYQLWEDETSDGRPRLRLLVDPGLGDVRATDVVEAFYDAVAARSDAMRVMAKAWQAAGVVVVERRPPVVTAGGKIPPICRARTPADSTEASSA